MKDYELDEQAIDNNVVYSNVADGDGDIANEDTSSESIIGEGDILEDSSNKDLIDEDKIYEKMIGEDLIGEYNIHDDMLSDELADEDTINEYPTNEESLGEDSINDDSTNEDLLDEDFAYEDESLEDAFEDDESGESALSNKKDLKISPKAVLIKCGNGIKSHKKMVFAAIAVCLAGAVGVSAFSFAKAKGEEVEAVPAATEQIIKQDLSKSIAVNGTIASSASYSLSSEVTDVTVSELNVSVGDRVKAGDVIAVLDTTSLEKSLEIANKNLETTKEKNELDVDASKRSYSNAISSSTISP